MRLLSASLLLLCSCMVFDESMRRPHADDAGVNAPLTDAGSIDAGSIDAGSSSSSGGTGFDAAVCAMAVPAGSGGGNCGGNGSGNYNGANETEPNDPTPQTLTRRNIVCGAVDGADVDRFAFAVQAKDCFELVFETDGPTALVTAPSAVDQTFDSNKQVGFQAAAAGTVTVTVRGAGHYRLLVR
jgi:hypothetical protein